MNKRPPVRTWFRACTGKDLTINGKDYHCFNNSIIFHAKGHKYEAKYCLRCLPVYFGHTV